MSLPAGGRCLYEQGDDKTKKFVALIDPLLEADLFALVDAGAEPGDAEDLFQDVSATLWEKFDTFREGSDFPGLGVSDRRITRCSIHPPAEGPPAAAFR